MGKRRTCAAALDLKNDGLNVDLEGVADNEELAALRTQLVETLIARIILLGQAKGRPRKEQADEEKIAA